MGYRPVTTAQWKAVEIVGSVAEDAIRIVFGGFLAGKGEVWIDDVTLSADDDSGVWTPIEIKNPGFEEGRTGEPPVGWKADTPGYLFGVTDDLPPEVVSR